MFSTEKRPHVANAWMQPQGCQKSKQARKAAIRDDAGQKPEIIWEKRETVAAFSTGHCVDTEAGISDRRPGCGSSGGKTDQSDLFTVGLRKIASGENCIQSVDSEKQSPVLQNSRSFSKPPILSPKPFLARKPSQSQRLDYRETPCSAPIKAEGAFRFSREVVRHVTAPVTSVRSDTTTTAVPATVNNSNAVWSSRGNIIDDQKLLQKKNGYEFRSHSLKRQQKKFPSDTSQVTGLSKEMEALTATNSDCGKKSIAKKSPPKISSKPHVRPPPLNIKQNIRKTQICKESEAGDPGGEVSPTPVSQIRQRFEEMKINFKKPVPDDVPKPTHTVVSRESVSAVAKELFKDVLEMKDIESFSKMETDEVWSSIEKKSVSNSAATEEVEQPSRLMISKTDLEYLYDDSWQSRQHDKVEKVASQSLKDFKERYGRESSSKVINSLISPKEKKKSFMETSSDSNVSRSVFSGDSCRVKEKAHADVLTASDMPTYPKVDQNQLASANFSDLPPPPDFPPPPPDPPKDKIDKLSKMKQISGSGSLSELATRKVDFMRHDIPVMRGAATRNHSSVSSTISLDSSSTFHADKRELSGQPLCEVNRSNPAFPLLHEEKQKELEKEILYYDNMDIMEKVREKREKDAKRLVREQSQGSEQDKQMLLSASVQDNAKLQIMPARPGGSRQEAELAPSGKSVNDFRNALGHLEYEYLKLKENLDATAAQVASPPRLPPKQLKFNRQSASNVAKNQSSPISPKNFSPACGDQQQGQTKLQLNLNNSTKGNNSPHLLSPTPQQTTQMGFASNDFPCAPHLLNQPLSPEEMRARVLVDEPLAPILEEDSVYGDSSCSSSVAGDEPSAVVSYPSLSSSTKKPDNEVYDDTDGETTETEHATSGSRHSLPGSKEASTLSESSGSDVSVRWQNNPIVSSVNQGRSQPTSKPKQSMTRKSVNEEGVYEFVSDDETNKGPVSKKYKRKRLQESPCCESSAGASSAEKEKGDISDQENQDVEAIQDVAPYGMVDLSKLEATFPKKAGLSDSVSRSKLLQVSSENEITPSSIMSSVNEFNERFGTLRRKAELSDEDCDLSDTPHFPLEVNKEDKTETLIKAKSCSKNKTLGSSRNYKERDEVGYDNLEKYGGESRRSNETELLNDRNLKYAKALKKKEANLKESELGGSYTFHTKDLRSLKKDSRDQCPGSRASLPLSRPVPHLERHSSAVSALDRHRGNIKRNATKADTCGKSPSLRKIEKNNQQLEHPSTFPRTRSNDSDISFILEKASKTTGAQNQLSEATLPNSSKDRTRDASLSLSLRRNKNTTSSSFRSRDEGRERVASVQGSNADQTCQSSVSLPADYDESLDDGVVNPYEEVQYPLEDESHCTAVHSTQVKAQDAAEQRVKAILDSIHPPETLYKPKLPLPRYPVDYDNFYHPNSTKPQKSKDIKTEDTGCSKVALTPTSSVPSPSILPSTSEVSDPLSSAIFTHSKSSSIEDSVELNKQPHRTSIEENTQKSYQCRKESRDSQDEDSESVASEETQSTRSFGFQIRSLLGGNQEGKYISPSLRRKRSLLKRSKSPGGSSRRSRTPPRSKSPSQSCEDERSSLDKNLSVKRNSKKDLSSTKSDVESSNPRTPKIKERSASQRLVERRGRTSRLGEFRSSFRRSKVSEGEDESTDHTTESEKSKSKMSSKWRRSKSQDRSPTRSKSKERFFGSSSRRAKSQERPMTKELGATDINIEDREEKTGKGFFRRSRSSSRKRERRSKSSERKEEEVGAKKSVNFFRKFLRSKKNGDEIVHVPLGKGVDMSESTEALSTILAYKGDEVSEKEGWNPPRPHPPQQTVKNQKLSALIGSSNKSNKGMRSPPSHRAKKMYRSRGDPGTGSSSDADGRNVSKKTKDLEIGNSGKGPVDEYGNLGPNRAFLTPPQKPARPSSRKNSASNSLPSSDSENHSRFEEYPSSRLPHPVGKEGGEILRRKLLRDYDSDTTTSALASDAESSGGVQSDADSGGRSLRSVLKGSPLSRLKGTRRSPQRPVRVLSPRRSQSDPNIFVESDLKHTYYNDSAELKNPYYNVDMDATPKDTQANKNQNSKAPPHRRKNNRESRRQTAPVDLAYASHQRQKYRTLVSLNSQTLRKVTERWLSEWRNQLPVGGFLITSWSDVALDCHKPLCMIGNSVVYSSVSTGNNQFKLGCQLYDQRDVDDRMLKRLESCAALPAHPNVCGICSHFPCRVPRSLLDPNSRGGAADALCVVISSRPLQSLQEHLDAVVVRDEPTEYHRQVLISILQLLQGLRHIMSSGIDVPKISPEHLVIAERKGFLQLLPHLDWTDAIQSTRRDVEKVADTYQSSDSDSNSASQRLSSAQQVARLIKRLLQNGSLATSAGGLGRPGDRSSAASAVSRIVVPGTKFSTAIKHLIRHLDTAPPAGIQEAIDVVQCALWGPEDLEDVGVDDVSPYSALELWIEMEQAKLVNSLAVLSPGEKLLPVSFLKHQYFAALNPEVLFKGLKILERV